MNKEMCILFCLLAFISGFKAGVWDAKHGYETGLKFGEYTKERIKHE